MKHYLLLGAISLLPGALFYLYVGWRAGFNKMLTGIAAYGLGVGSCPIWPTGLGITGIAVGLLQGALILFVLMAPISPSFSPQYKKYFWIAGLIGLLAVPLAFWYMPFLKEQPGVFSQGINSKSVAAYVGSMSTYLFPAMWWAFLVLLVSTWNLLRTPARRISPNFLLLAIFTLAGIGMSARYLFSSILGPTPSIYASSYTILLVLSVWLLLQFEQRATEPRRAFGISLSTLLVAVMLGYAALRGAYFYTTERTLNYHRLKTYAGTVYMAGQGYEQASAMYEFLRARTKPGDYMLDIAYGGAINFALRLKSPVFTTQFGGLIPPEEMKKEDVIRLQKNTPRYIIAYESGTAALVSGLRSLYTGCPFPRLVWRSDVIFGYPNTPLPIAAHIDSNYKSIANVAGHLVLERKNLAANVIAATAR